MHMWNFNSGSLLRRFVCPASTSEITGLHFVADSVRECNQVLPTICNATKRTILWVVMYA